MKYVFIVNPISASGQAMEMAKRVEKVCKQENLDYEMRYISEEKNGAQIAKEYNDENNVIYNVGGDGNLFVILNGIIGSKNKLGVIPAGSGNDFQKTLKQMDNGDIEVDVGKINDKYFINIACIGIDAETAYNVEMLKGKVPTNKLYDVSVLYTFFKYKFKKLEFKYNDKIESGIYTIVTVCNGKYYGGGYKIAPNAKINDGLFDFYYAKKISKLKIPKLIGLVKNGEHENNKVVKKEHTKKVIIESEKDLICCADGETMISKKFEIEIIPKAVIVHNDQNLINKILNCKLDDIETKEKSNV